MDASPTHDPHAHAAGAPRPHTATPRPVAAAPDPAAAGRDPAATRPDPVAAAPGDEDEDRTAADPVGAAPGPAGAGPRPHSPESLTPVSRPCATPRRAGARRPLHVLAAGTVLAVPLVTLSAVSATSGPGAGTSPGSGAYGYPLAEPVEVVREFDAPEERWLSGHRGVDLRAEPGDPVVAPADGVVTFAGPVGGRIVLTLRHPDGRRSSVEPVTPTVGTGDAVTRGAPVGQVDTGPTHCAPATCLHWGVRAGTDAYVDPLTLLTGRGPVVLLPGGP